MAPELLTRIAEILDEGDSAGRKPYRVVIGNAEADQLDAELRRGLPYMDAGPDPLVPLGVTGTLFGVEVLRVDQPTIIGVIWDDGTSEDVRY